MKEKLDITDAPADVWPICPQRLSGDAMPLDRPAFQGVRGILSRKKCRL